MKIVALGLTILAAIVGLANSKRCGQEEGGEITELLVRFPCASGKRSSGEGNDSLSRAFRPPLSRSASNTVVQSIQPSA